MSNTLPSILRFFFLLRFKYLCSHKTYTDWAIRHFPLGSPGCAIPVQDSHVLGKSGSLCEKRVRVEIVFKISRFL